MISIDAVITVIRDDVLLEKAVESLLAQHTPGIDFQILVGFDGPVEESPRAWKADDRVVIHRFPVNQGVGGALRSVIALSTADYVARLDSDDIALPGRIRKQVRVLENNPDIAVLGTSAMLINQDGEVMGELGARGDGGVIDVKDGLWRKNPITHSSIMMSRAAYERAGGYDASLRKYEDYDLFLRLALVGRVAVLDEPLVQYRLHEGQITRSFKLRGLGALGIARRQRSVAKVYEVPAHQRVAWTSAWLAAQYLSVLGLRRWNYQRFGQRASGHVPANGASRGT
ncbi:MAG: glycosyltransferase [Ancrocorticia sp.]|uniref:glycosyltransferase n=1 Tax=Ancrocorticia sp. TaxID=2593684 RepID=UPI003F90F851